MSEDPDLKRAGELERGKEHDTVLVSRRLRVGYYSSFWHLPWIVSGLSDIWNTSGTEM
jgi:hypothetical protein